MVESWLVQAINHLLSNVHKRRSGLCGKLLRPVHVDSYVVLNDGVRAYICEHRASIVSIVSAISLALLTLRVFHRRLMKHALIGYSLETAIWVDCTCPTVNPGDAVS